MVQAFIALLGCQLAGTALASGMGLPVPGAVLGMALMLVLLCLWPGVLLAIRGTAEGLLRLLPLLFVPAGVGVIAQLDRVESEGGALIAAFVLSTLLAVLAAAVTFVAVARMVGAGDD